MYKKTKPQPTSITVNETYEGERLEQKINRIVNNKEPIKDGAPIIYTERKKGVQPEYNIRNDKWETALDAMTAVAGQHRKNRQDFHDKLENENKKLKNGGAEPTQGTE